jgi:hypothetical protein
MSTHDIEICVKGKYFTVPALSVDGKNIIVTGHFIKTAVIHAEEWLETELENPQQCIEKLRDHGSNRLKADIFTFSQKLPILKPKYAYPMEWESIAAIPLTSFEDWWNELPQETRKNVRRAMKKGVIANVEDLHDDVIKGIVCINSDSPMRQGRSFDHYGKSFFEVKRDQSSFIDRSAFICAYSAQELIGFMKIVFCGKVGMILQFLPKASASDKRPANAMLSKAVEHCIQKGMSYLVYGMYTYGNKRDTSLLEFKKRNGFEEILVPRFYAPLTLKGRIAIALKLHRDIVGVLPQWSIGLGLELRKKWYKLKLLARPV